MPFENLSGNRGSHHLRRGVHKYIYGDALTNLAIGHNEAVARLSAAGAAALTSAGYNAKLGMLAPASIHNTATWGAAMTDFATNFCGVAANALAADSKHRKLTIAYDGNIEVATASSTALMVGTWVKLDTSGATVGGWIAATDQDDAMGFVVEQAPLHLPSYDNSLNSLGAPVKVEIALLPQFARGHAAADWTWAVA